MARTKSKNWLKYDIAQQVVIDAGVKSRAQYERWHVANKIKDIPKQPNRVYGEWDGWPVFLKTGNVFGADKDSIALKYMAYWDAIRWAQAFCNAHKITSGTEWKRFYTLDRESGRNAIPLEVPKHPDNYYKDDWSGWPAWLGKHLTAKIEAQKQQISLLCVATNSWSPSNVVSIVVARDGELHLVEQLQNRGLTPRYIFKFDNDLSGEIQGILEQCGTLQPSGAWIVHNVPNLVSELSYILQRHTVHNREAFAELSQTLQSQRSPSPMDGFEEPADNAYSLKVGTNPFI